MINEKLIIKSLSDYLNETESVQIEIFRGLSTETHNELFKYFFPNSILEFNATNNFLISSIDKLSDTVIKLALKVLCNNYIHTSVGAAARLYPMFFALLLKNRQQLLIELTTQDILTAENISKNKAEQIVYNVLIANEGLSDAKQVKNFFTLLHLNDEIFQTLADKADPLWFSKIIEYLSKIDPSDSFLDEILWNDLYIKIKNRLDYKPNEGWERILRTIFYTFIEPNHSHIYKTIYSILDKQTAYKYSSRTFTFQTKYLDFLVIPYYATESRYEILSHLFLSKNPKYLKKMETRFINNPNFEIDSCGLLFTSVISELFDNYGLRQTFQLQMCNIKIKDELFFYGDFKDFFTSFINSLKYIKFFYGEARLLKILVNCDWGEDVNILSHCDTAFFKIKHFNLFNKETQRSKPKTSAELHTIIFKTVGNYESSLNFIFLNKDPKLDSINGLKVGEFKFIIPENNIHLNQFSIEMGNCVRGYTDKINTEQSQIINVFKENKAYANIEIINNCVTEIKGKFNKELPEDDIRFFKKILMDKEIIHKNAI